MLYKLLLLLSGKLLAERCCTDDLMPSIPVLCLPPSRVDPKVLGLNVHNSTSIALSQVDLGRPGGLRQSGGGRSAAAMTRWWSSSGADRARCPKNLNRNDLTFSETGKHPVMLLTVSFVVCLVPLAVATTTNTEYIINTQHTQYMPSNMHIIFQVNLG